MARSKGTGSITKIGSVYYLRYTVNGKQKKVSLRTQKRREAEKKAAELMDDNIHARTMTDVVTHIACSKGLVDESKIKNIKVAVDREQGKGLKISDTWDTYLESANRPNTGEATLKEYKRYWSRFEEWATGFEFLHEVSAKDSDTYCSHLLKTFKMSPATYNKYITFYKHLCKVLSLQATLDENPFIHITKKQAEHYDIREFSDEEFNLVINSLSGEMKLLFYLGAYAGMRLKDAALCKWESIDMHRNALTFKPAKTKRRGKIVEVPIVPALRDELQSALAYRQNEFILPDLAGKYTRDRTLVNSRTSRAIRQALKESSKSPTFPTFHSLRHYFVSVCAKSGVPLAIVQALVGHGSPAMTRHYTHIDLKTSSEAMKAIDLNLSGSEPKEEPLAIEVTDDRKLQKVIALAQSMNSKNWNEKRNKILGLMKK